jgi:hypothetical protein
MNNCIFSTHATLTKEHAEYSLRSLLCYQTEDTVWDNFIIYNSHSDEIPNEWLENKIQELDTKKYINNLITYPYDQQNFPKTLTQDIINQFTMLVDNNLNQPGKTLILKSDYCLSNKFNKVFNRISHLKHYIWSLPIYNSKSKASQIEIDKLCKLNKFEFAMKGVYYRGGTNDPITPGTLYSPLQEFMPNKIRNFHTLNIPYNEYTGGHHFDTDPSIRFVSHNIQNDYNVHVFSNDVLKTCKIVSSRTYDRNIDWGATQNLFNEAFYCENIMRVKEIEAFAVHMFHDIISPNRSSTRPDRRKTVPGEEY